MTTWPLRVCGDVNTSPSGRFFQWLGVISPSLTVHLSSGLNSAVKSFPLSVTTRIARAFLTFS